MYVRGVDPQEGAAGWQRVSQWHSVRVGHQPLHDWRDRGRLSACREIAYNKGFPQWNTLVPGAATALAKVTGVIVMGLYGFLHQLIRCPACPLNFLKARLRRAVTAGLLHCALTLFTKTSPSLACRVVHIKPRYSSKTWEALSAARTTTSASREHASLAHRRRWVAASGEHRASALRARHLPRALDSAWPAVCQLGRLRLAGAARTQCTAGDASSRAGPVAVAAPAARAAALLASEAEQKYLRRDVTALQRWAAKSLASFGVEDAPPISLLDVLWATVRATRR